jgi:tetratricopeptide (TPR) repeat protein
MGRLSTRCSVLFSCCVYFLSSVAVPRSGRACQVSAAGFEVSGAVYYKENDRPAENVTVTLRETGGVLRAQAVTDVGGRFNFGSLNRGSYDVTATLTGYEPASTAVTVQNGSGRGAILYLERNPSPQSGKESPGQSANQGSVSAHELSMPQKARDLMLSGKQKIFYAKDVQGGLADFQKAVAIAPGYYEAYYQIAMTLLELGKRDEAEKNFRKAIELSNDKYGEPSIGLGTILLDKGDAVAAEKMIRHGLELSPNSWLGYYELGRAHLGENRLADAKKAGEQARSLMPNAAIVYRLLANVHMREKDYPALLADIDTYVRLDPDSAAGLHAKEMRAEVVQKIQDEKVVTENATPK